MSWAYIDSSAIVASIFGEISSKEHSIIWKKSRQLISSYLLQAEVASAVSREKIIISKAFESIGRIGFIRTESLLHELSLVFAKGHLRGADAFHLATALWISNQSKMDFITFDKRQAQIAEELGFNCLVRN